MLALLAQLHRRSLWWLHHLCHGELVAKGLQQKHVLTFKRHAEDCRCHISGVGTCLAHAVTAITMKLQLSQGSSCCHERAVGLTLVSPLPCHHAGLKQEQHSFLSRQ